MRPISSDPSLLEFELALQGKRVLVTGHTGFTGGWLVSWLKHIGCDVAGLTLAPATEPSLFVVANVANDIQSTIGDIREFATVRSAIEQHRPSVIIHLAAQPLVSKSFVDPIETFANSALGTVHVLEAARLTPDVKAVVCITTDKVYRDQDHRPCAFGAGICRTRGGSDGGGRVFARLRCNRHAQGRRTLARRFARSASFGTRLANLDWARRRHSRCGRGASPAQSKE
jgi:nucleoside-diphosphate-sugar epimerase